MPEVVGPIDDCCCGVEDVAPINEKFVHPVLRSLVERTFFKYFKVDLTPECPFWMVEPTCSDGGACHLGECDEDEIPAPWKKEDGQHLARKLATVNKVDRETDEDLSTWEDTARNWWLTPEDTEEDMTYVDLTRNPEVNTGYVGPSAMKVWIAIYKENCFQRGKLDDMCYEERVFFRLVSGIHASITASVSSRFFKTAGGWGPNIEVFKKGLGNFPDRLKNLYFTYLFLLRAVVKAKPTLERFDYNTGNPVDDAQTKMLVSELVSLANDEICSSAFNGFNDTAMFGEGKEKLKTEFQSHFRNISMISNCVACESCKMHMKMKTHGLGVAMMILFEDKESSMSLHRNEIIALINTLMEFSHTLKILQEMRDLEIRELTHKYLLIGAGVLGVLLFAGGWLWGRRGKAAAKPAKKTN